MVEVVCPFTFQVQYCTWWDIVDLALLKIHLCVMVCYNVFKVM